MLWDGFLELALGGEYKRLEQRWHRSVNVPSHATAALTLSVEHQSLDEATLHCASQTTPQTWVTLWIPRRSQVQCDHAVKVIVIDIIVVVA
eukprot:4659876-Amphidinium_carterae.2